MARYFGGFRDRLKKRSKHLPLSEKDYDWIKVATTFSGVPAKRDYQWLEPEDYLSSFLSGENTDPAQSTEFQGDGSMDSMSDAPLPYTDSDEEEKEAEQDSGQVMDSIIRLRPSIDVPAELPSLQEYKLEVISALKRRGIRIEMDKIALPADLEEQLIAYHEKRGGPIDSYDLRARLQKYKQQVIDSYDQFAALGTSRSLGGKIPGIEEFEKSSGEEEESYESFILSSLNRLEAFMREESALHEEKEENEKKSPSSADKTDSLQSTLAGSKSPFTGNAWSDLPVESPESEVTADSASVDYEEKGEDEVVAGTLPTPGDTPAIEERKDLAGSPHADKDELLKAFNTIGSRPQDGEEEVKAEEEQAPSPSPSYIHHAIETYTPEKESSLEDDAPLADFLLQLRQERDDAGSQDSKRRRAHELFALEEESADLPAPERVTLETALPNYLTADVHSSDASVEDVNGQLREEEESDFSSLSKGLGRARYLEEERKKLYSLIGKLEQESNFAEAEEDPMPILEDSTPDALDFLGEIEEEIVEEAEFELPEPLVPATEQVEQDDVFGASILIETERLDEISSLEESSDSDFEAVPEAIDEPVMDAETYPGETPLMDEIQGEDGWRDESADEDPERAISNRTAQEPDIMRQPHMNQEDVSANMPEANIHPDEMANDSMRSEASEGAPEDMEAAELTEEDIAAEQADSNLDADVADETPVDDGLVEADQALAQDVPLDAVIESLAFAAEDPIPLKRIARIYSEMQGVRMPTEKQMSEAIERINAHYEETGRAFRIKRWGGGIRMASHPQYARFIRALYDEHRPKKLSRTLMETLAIIAYSQPTTKPEVDFVRGVDSDYAVRKLLEIGLIDIVGRSDSIGRPLLYGTSERFLEQFGLSTLEALPKLREVEELLGDPAFKKERLHLLALEGMEEAAMAIDEGRADEEDASESHETEAKNAEE